MSRSPSRRWDYLPAFAQEQLPRYTSYPPANRFTDEIGANQAVAALNALPEGARLSLYVHLPFCKKLCWYCGCHTSVPTMADPIASYLDALTAEFARVAQELPANARITHLHFGGGSPDILEPKQIGALFASLRWNFEFSPFAEISAEFDPRGAKQSVVAAYAAGGLTRASLGVQVLNITVQTSINRIQSAAEISAAIERFRDAGIQALNLDMMYGLPGQTQEHVIETALFAAHHDVDRIAVFGYAHVPWFKKHQKAIREAQLPVGEARFRQAEIAAQSLECAGYMPIGFDHFAAPGDSLVAAERDCRLHRNFQGYTSDQADALIGFGASAISSLPNMIYQNTPDSALYRNQIAANSLPVVRGIALTPEHRRIGGLIERLLCDFEANIPADLEIRACSRLAPLVSAGLVERQPGRITVTSRGRPYVRNVAACFDPAFGEVPGRHSLAV